MDYKIIEGRRYPIVYCKQKKGQWVFYCDFCKEYHHHSPAEGHRNAHCHWSSPYAESGYYLMLGNRRQLNDMS
jgi:hypothetical protein